MSREPYEDHDVVLHLTRDEAEAIAIALKMADQAWRFDKEIVVGRIERPAYRHIIAADTAAQEIKDCLAEIGVTAI